MAEFRVDISREDIVQVEVKGVTVTEDSGLNFVDCYFPDGTQRTCGYVLRNGPPGSAVFQPLSGIHQGLVDMIQAEINKQRGYKDGGPPAPLIFEYTGNEFTQEDDEDD